MGKLREGRNKSKETTLIDRIPRIEIELAGISSDLGNLETYVNEQIAAIDINDALEGGVIRLNGHVLTSNATIVATKSGVVVGPVEVPDGKSITIEDGGVLVIL
jgi:hypothetical protein